MKQSLVLAEKIKKEKALKKDQEKVRGDLKLFHETEVYKKISELAGSKVSINSPSLELLLAKRVIEPTAAQMLSFEKDDLKISKEHGYLADVILEELKKREHLDHVYLEMRPNKISLVYNLDRGDFPELQYFIDHTPASIYETIAVSFFSETREESFRIEIVEQFVNDRALESVIIFSSDKAVASKRHEILSRIKGMLKAGKR